MTSEIRPGLIREANDVADRIAYELGVIMFDDGNCDQAKRFVESCVRPSVIALVTKPHNPAIINGLVGFKQTPPDGYTLCIGERVRKKSGASWRGYVVGYYWTRLTPHGVAVESAHEPGAVQIYPEHALERGE